MLVPDANNPIGIDVAKDGKVYWSEIGNPISLESTGYIKMYDPAKPAGNKATVVAIETRADHGNSEDGVLGMSLQPGFDLEDATKRNLFVYYSPRNAAWPMTGNAQVVGYNQISRYTLTADGASVVPGSERVILRVPKAKISGSPAGFTGGPTDSGPGHVGGAGLDFDSAGNLYLGVGDDVSPNASGHGGYAPMDFRAKERWDARKTSQNSADLRGKILRITPKQGDIAAGAEPGVDTTYAIPSGNLFPVGTAKARPEIYAMGFRQPFTLHTDPANPGIVGTGEFCHDTSTNAANRSPAGTCEWDLLNKPGNHGWPFCVGNNSTANTLFRWNYATNSTTGQQYDCNATSLPSDIRYAPTGQTAVEPTFDGLDTLPGPVEKATIWKKYAGAADGQNPADFGNLDAGGMQPLAGPIYRYPSGTATQGAFPRYYDGSWLIGNRGADNGFWKEVKMRKDNNEMLRVSDWLPYNGGVNPSGANSSLVIGSQFGPDGALYMSRFSVGCCRAQTNANNQNQIVKISFNVQDECLTDTNAPNASAEVTGQAYPDRPNTYVNTAKLKLTAMDSGCAGVNTIEYRQQGTTAWLPYTAEVTFDEAKTYTVEYRATDRKDNVSAAKTTTFEILKINDTTAPVVTAAASGNKDQRDYFVGSATLTLTATDNEPGAAGVQTVEYRTNGGTLDGVHRAGRLHHGGHVHGRLPCHGQGQQHVRGQVDDVPHPLGRGLHAVAIGRVQRHGAVRAVAAAHPQRRHARERHHGRRRQPALLTADLELDGNSTNTAVGPVNFIGQDLPSLGSAWNVETEFTVKYNGGWQNAGLIVWNGDNNFFRASITHSLGDGNLYTELSKDNPTSTEGDRAQSGGNAVVAPNSSQAVTVRMRMTRAEGANTVGAQYRIMAPASLATPAFVDFGNVTGFLDLNPSGGPRRDAAGSRIGIIAGSNFPGEPGTYPYAGTPGTVDINYFRVTPDPMTCETVAPTTTATLDPAAPAAGDTYDRAVKVNFSATDNLSGVDATEYRVNTNGNTGEWKSLKNSANESPFVNTVTVAANGTHVVEYRSSDVAANTEATKSVTFKVTLPECVRSDEFVSASLNTDRWSFRHSTTPTTGAKAPFNENGSLVLPLGAFSLDLDRTGPAAVLGQPLPAGDFTVVTKITAPGLDSDVGGVGSTYSQVGLKVFQNANYWIKAAQTRNADGSPTGSVQSYFEMTTESNGTRVLGTRQGLAAPSVNLPTWWMRMRLVGTTLTSEYSLTDPDGAGATWVSLGTANINTILPTSAGTRYIAAYGGNGSISARYDYIRITPDDCPTGADTTAPTTTASSAPAPNAAGWSNANVNVTLTGTDNANGSGVDKVEYKVDGGAFATYSAPVAITADGTHTVEYRSTDKAGNVEATKSLTVKVDKAAPVTTATLQPATSPTAGPVTLTLAATDPVSGVAGSEYQVNAASPFGALKLSSAALAWVAYDPANKPVFTAPGVYSVDYRSTDAAGNVEAAKSVSFTIAAQSNDKTAPVTTQSLDPAAPGAGKTYSGPVKVKFSALDQAPGGAAAKTVDVSALGDRWSPGSISLNTGDTVRWNFAADTAVFPHDVWSVAPGGNMAVPEKVSEIIIPGGPSQTKTLTQNGTWTFVCKIHSFYDSAAGAWSGMVGTATVTPAPTAEQPSGVDFTEYKVNDGAWTKATNTAGSNPFASEVTVEAEGQHTVQFRSTDKAGNVETAKSVAFGIDIPEPGTPVIEAFADPATGAAPLVTRLSASGYDPEGGELSYKWEFADGIVIGKAVTRTFTKPGSYTAKVTATDPAGEKSSKEVTVTVTGPGVQPPTVEIAADRTSGPAPMAVKFTGTGADPDGNPALLQYAWDFGDGGKSFDPNPTHIYNAPGTFTARVTVTDGSGATASKTVTITVAPAVGNVAPVVTTAFLPNPHGNPLEVDFTAEADDPNGDPVTFEWDFDDNSGKQSGGSVSHIYAAAGTYNAKVTASDGKGGTTTQTVTVTVSPAANVLPTLDVLADPGQGTGPLVVRFSSQASDPDSPDPLKYTWAFGDGGFSAEPNPVHTYLAAGTYTATLTVEDRRGGKTSKSLTITVTAVAGAAPAPKAPDAAPEQAPWFGVSEPVKTSVSGFAKQGLAVKVTCTTAMTGTAKLLVSSKVAKALGLKSTTLASVKVNCANAGSKALKLKAGSKVKKALAKAKGSVKVTLSVSLKAKGEASKHSTRAITLTRR